MTDTVRPLGFGEILDGAFALLRRHFGTFFGMTFLPFLPMVAFWLLVPMVADPDLAVILFGTGSLLMLPYVFFSVILIMGAVTHAGNIAWNGGTPTIGDSLRAALRRFFPLAIAAVIAGFLMSIGFLFFLIPGMILATMFFAIFPAGMIESAGGIEALGRSRQLSRGARMRILGVYIVTWCITLAPTIAFYMIVGATLGVTGLLSATSGTGTWSYGLLQAGSYTVSAITYPFYVLITLMLYYDRRARTEATDLESAAAALSSHV